MVGMLLWLLTLSSMSIAPGEGARPSARPSARPNARPNRTTGRPRAANRTSAPLGFNFESYLDAAIMMIRAAKNTMPLEIGNASSLERMDMDEPPGLMEEEEFEAPKCPPKPIDCEELLVDCDVAVSGVYQIYPRSRVDTWGDGGFEVFCDMDTDGGGWTVIQRRDDFGASPDFFFKDWESYKQGFGDLNYDYWIGNDKLFALSNQRRSALRFDLSDFESGRGFATYDDFYIEDESEGYRLHLGDFRGDIGDSFTAHNKCKFTAKDRDNDNNYYNNCALLYKGGWWYNDCHTVNLHGLYLKGYHSSFANGVNWYGFKGFHYSLKRTEMKLRSADFARVFNPEVAMQL